MKMVGRPPKLTPEQKAALVCKFRAGVSKTALVREYGIAYKTVYCYVHDIHKNPALRAASL